MSKKIDASHHPIDIYERKHRGGHLVSEHHHSTHQLLFALEGEGRLRLAGRSYVLAADDIALILPYTEHAVMSDSKLTLLVLAFDETVLDPQIAEQLLRTHFRQSELMRPGLFAASELKQLLRKMLFEQAAESSAFGLLALKIQLAQLLLLLARTHERPVAGAGPNRQRAEKIRAYIDTHYFDPLTPADLAAKAGISSRHVNTLFKECYDRTPMQYLTEVRVRVAQKLLTDTDHDIISICFEVGCNSVSTFYRTFKNVSGMSPKSYRESARPDGSEAHFRN